MSSKLIIKRLDKIEKVLLPGDDGSGDGLNEWMLDILKQSALKPSEEESMKAVDGAYNRFFEGMLSEEYKEIWARMSVIKMATGTKGLFDNPQLRDQDQEIRAKNYKAI